MFINGNKTCHTIDVLWCMNEIRVNICNILSYSFELCSALHLHPCPGDSSCDPIAAVCSNNSLCECAPGMTYNNALQRCKTGLTFLCCKNITN